MADIVAGDIGVIIELMISLDISQRHSLVIHQWEILLTALLLGFWVRKAQLSYHLVSYQIAMLGT